MYANKILAGFISGASLPAFALFFIGFHGYIGKYNPGNCVKNWFGLEPYFLYTLLAPAYLGTMSAIAVALHLHYKWSIFCSFALISVISAIIVSILITVCNIYNFTPERLFQQYLKLIVYHFIVYNVIIANVYKAIT